MAAGLVRGQNDPVGIVGATIAGAEAPLRLPLGADTYRDVRATYLRRLEILEASHDLATSVT